MKRLLSIVLLALLTQSGPLLAADDPVQAAIQPETPALLACPTPGAQRTAEVSQKDCCKGHKGVCGCRAGKLVCCDNSTSPACTCHSDWGVAN